MNQDLEKNLRDKIRKIQQNSDMSPEEKQRSIQDVLSQRFDLTAIPNTPTECQYYPERKCTLLCNICKQFYHCRFCHNESQDHKFDRHNVKSIKCMDCKILQIPQQSCENCGIEFGKYYCDKCYLYCESTDVFHCDGCKICRKGPQEDYQHCHKCSMCIRVEALNDHVCFESTFEGDCAICGDSLFDMRQYGSLLKCGHAIHQNCMQQYVSSNYRCPLCKKSMVDMTAAWKELSEHYKDALDIRDHNRSVQRYCNDCCELFENSFSPFMLYQCPLCKGFNNC